MIKQAPLLLLLSLILSPLQAAFHAALERDTIQEGETVVLQLQSSGQQSGEPDTTALQQDFEVVGSSRSSQVNIINGQMNAQTIWSLTLSPRRVGELTIPALHYNGEQSTPLHLTVTEVEAATAEQGAPLFIETEVDNASPYLQQMVHYRVQLYYRAKLAEGSLSNPKIDNVLIQQLGEDREFTAKRNGVGYRVVERNYALFPQQSGTITIPAPVLDARIIQPNSTNRGRNRLEDLFNNGRMSTTRSVRIRGEEKSLSVRPRPKAHQAARWIPAEQLLLSESWNPEADEVQIGVPLSRTLTLQAESLTGTMLPDITPEAVEGFKLYPEPSTQQTETSSRRVVGTKVRKIAYIPTKAGEFTLPAIELSWWNSREKRTEVAEIPARTLTVLPAEGATETTPPEPAPSTSDIPVAESSAVEPTAHSTSSTPSGSIPTVHYQPTLWLWGTLAFALLWLVTLLLWWRSRATTESREETMESEPTSCKGARKQFFAACDSSQPQQARIALLQWAACHWPDDPPKGLDALAQRLDTPAVPELLSELDGALYQQGAAVWCGDALAQHLRRLPEQQREKEKERQLRPLYP